ncbi:MAG: hypothetical protein FWC89_03230 [Defluviitaleaceae bacterium]|nr:hypothetical protein [Defluviitaleaceae bacterium]
MKNEIVIQATFRCSTLWKFFCKYCLLLGWSVFALGGVFWIVSSLIGGVSDNIGELIFGLVVVGIFGGATIMYVIPMVWGDEIITFSNESVTLHERFITIPWKNIISVKRYSNLGLRTKFESVEFTYKLKIGKNEPSTQSIEIEPFATAYTARQIVKMAKKFQNN